MTRVSSIEPAPVALRAASIAFAAFLSLFVTPALADVWEIRSDGTTVFHQALDYTQRNRGNSDWQAPTEAVLRARRANYDPIIQEAAAKHGVDPLLLHALIEIESGYDPFAVSKAGAIGMMQLMPKTAARFGVPDSRDPKANISGGAEYLAYLNRIFSHDTTFVVAAYHAGENRVAPCRHLAASANNGNCERWPPMIPNITETRRHVKRVMEALARRQQAAAQVATARLPEMPAAVGDGR